MRTLLILVLLLASRAACAQVAQPWPCNAATGKIEFIGQLPWPDSVRTEAQRQRLARRWYRQKLTNDRPAVIRDFIRESGTTYAGVPAYSCYRIGIITSEEERFGFCFKIDLTTNDAHLTYRLTNFECTESVYDAATGALLEDALNLADARTQSFLELFHQQLLTNLKGW